MDRRTEELLRRAAKSARRCGQRYHHCALAIRADGAHVYAVNSTEPARRNWRTHAEARICRKATPHSIVYVIRMKSNGELANSEPCPSCVRLLKRAGVRKVFFSTGPESYGVLTL